MKILVRVFGELTQIVGNRHNLELDEKASISTLAEMIAKITGQKRRGYLGEFEVGGSEMAILVNGRNIDLLDGLETVLRDGDEVVLLIPTMGG
jgi:molybdopterin synthase sulfur carrier subunit